ncbi:trehalose-6-phosphate synthase [Lentzea tibetensis]|uniref:Trehalose-6-phosphate synthase n=1 Tax=Lentzea tibetensis TaxID=2591470 RepID=A0A563EHX8_9PSEU|nr:trehalose-6-phosphate synthase [Lentzea tibetensis]TWP46113.1 trehalose-6-phosphate synthase [Lentzea tibetensis]
MVLKREATPTGPVTDLFDRLHELHLDAGEPGVRQIATGIGRGVLSYTTVHNVFRGPKVPKWGHLELIVEQLGGDVEAFRTLWRTARLAELAAPGPNEPGPVEPERHSAARDYGRTEPDAVAAGPVDHVDDGQQFDFVLVTHRIPVHGRPDAVAGGAWTYSPVGVDAILGEEVGVRNGAWVGWSWQPGESVRSAALGRVHLRSIELSDREIEWHKEGYCNSTLWPIYHDSIERPEFHRDWRDAHRVVNRRYADAVTRVAAPGAVVWVHDYQLQLVPAMLRALRPDLRIGFFLHIAQPPVELFGQLPEREETLRGLLGADLVGFQHPRGVSNFLRLCTELLGLEVGTDSVVVDGRRVRVEAHPISVDVAAIEEVVNRPRITRRAAQIRAELGNPRTLLVGIDRLDYTKGIEQRLLAYGELLDGGQLSADSSAFLQVATLSRENLARYALLRERVDRLAGHLNASYGRMGNPVVHYTNRVLDRDEIMALYVAADVMVVTPLRDGMNLVSKEYVASRVDNRGVLVLSEFAGAAHELSEALLVNPNDVDDLKNAVLRAVAMSPAEQGRRMEVMRKHVREHDAQAWVDGFLKDLG